MVRAYDKFAQSNGEIDSIRWEVEYKGETADAVFRSILLFPEGAAEYQHSIVNMAVSAVSFIEKKDKNLSRNTLIKWWSDWLEYLASCPVKVRVLRAKTSIQKKKNWIRVAVSKSIAMLQDVLEIGDFEAYLHQIIVEARFRYQAIDEIMIRDYLRNECLIE
jgi:DNA relaxase NicK